jgi:ABC-type sugar transport system substrate-binding protein
MHRSVISALAKSAWLSLVLVLPACDDSFVPPPRSELSALREQKPPAVRTVEICLPDEPTTDREFLEQEFRTQAGLGHVFFQIKKVSAKSAAQAEWVRGAKARGASALIVEPLGGEDLAQALEQVREEGIPVVLIGQPVNAGAKPFTLVTHPSFTQPARELMQAATEDVKAAKLPDHGGAVILTNSFKDPQSEERLAELTAALKGANVPLLDTVTFHAGGDAAKKAAAEALKAHPQLNILLAEEDQGFIGASLAKDELKDSRNVILCGTLASSKDLNISAVTQSAAYVDRNTKRVGRLAFKAALDLVEGKSVPNPIMVDYEVHRIPPHPSREAMPKKDLEGRRPAAPAGAGESKRRRD